MSAWCNHLADDQKENNNHSKKRQQRKIKYLAGLKKINIRKEDSSNNL